MRATTSSSTAFATRASLSVRTSTSNSLEILRGPASSFAGRGTTGGALNIVTKEAQPVDFYHIGTEGGFGDSTKRGTIDLNKALSSVLDVRVNGLIQYADVAGRDFTTDNRWGLAGNVYYHPTAKFKANANYAHTYLWGIPDFGVPYDQTLRAPVTEGIVPRDTYYGATNRDFTKSGQDVGTLDLAYELNDHVTLENKFRASHTLLNYIGTIPENPSATGATAPYNSTPTFFSGYVQLNAQSRYEPVDVINDQPEATFRFNTGEIRHTAVAGSEFSSEKISIQGYSGLTSELTTGPVAFASSGAPIVSVFNPPHTILGGSPIQLAGNPLRYNVDTKAAYLMDSANYHDFIILNAGVRYDDYHIKSANNTSSQTADDGITSYNAGIVVKPVKIGSFYFAYATAADPVGAELDATASAYGGFAPTQSSTQIFGPQKSRSYEFGTKWELFNRHLLVSAAPFETDVTNARETAPNGLPGYTSGQIVAGAAYRVRGIDFEARWQADKQVEPDGRLRDHGPQGHQVDCADQRGLAIGEHRTPVVQPADQIPVDETAGDRRPGRLRLADQGRFATRREWRCGLSESAESHTSSSALALRHLRRSEAHRACKPEALRAEPAGQDLL